MRTFKFEPRACENDEKGTYRPFFIDGVEVYRLYIQIVMGDDKEAANKEMLGLCEKIKEVTGAIISPGELPHVIKERKITTA